jgi:chromosome partitioning protein
MNENARPSTRDTSTKAAPGSPVGASARLPVVTGQPGQPWVIVLGNEKGGTGKSTTAMHLVVALLRGGHRVGILDLDARQGTISRYVANRRAYRERHGIAELPVPELRPVERGGSEAEEAARFEDAFAALKAECGFVVMDTPGSDTFLSRLGHTLADTLITPMNDSFIDLDLLATVDPDTLEILKPSTYATMVWDQRKQRALRRARPIDWIVMRNRLSALDARNKRDVASILDRLAKRIGFRLAPGFGERVIFRELFLKGLTLLDLRDLSGSEARSDVPMTMSHVAARQEVRTLLETIGFGLVTSPAAGPETRGT